MTLKQFAFSWGLVILAALFDSYASFIVKVKFNELGRFDLSSATNMANYLLTMLKSPILVTALITFVMAPAMWFFALNKLDLSIAYPVLVGFHLIFVMVLGLAFLGEPFTANKMIGSVLIMASLYFFHR